VPQLLIVDRQGVVRAHVIGPRPPDAVVACARALALRE
jgi:hypothetical protein